MCELVAMAMATFPLQHALSALATSLATAVATAANLDKMLFSLDYSNLEY